MSCRVSYFPLPYFVFTFFNKDFNLSFTALLQTLYNHRIIVVASAVVCLMGSATFAYLHWHLLQHCGHCLFTFLCDMQMM